jgi:hypothetical protein
MIVDTFNAEADTQAEELFAGQATTKMEVKNDNTILWIIALNMDIDTFNETITAQMDETLPPMAEEMLETYRETGLKDLGIELVITNSAGTELYTKEFR